MIRDWTDFKSLHGNIAGAREAFEDACETLYKKKYKDQHVSQVKVKQGDGGIDIFIGELGVEPITVIQCKFFLESFGATQHSQIRESFNTAITSEKYELKEWILCIPRVIDIDENTWWFKWKHKKLKEHTKNKSFIKLTNGNELIDLLKELGLYNQVFKIDDSIKIDEIHKQLVPVPIDLPKDIKPSTVLFNNYSQKNEPFYLNRDSDSEFNNSLEISNIWLFGKSGVGKTALINRNLIQNKTEYCFCDLSPITITKVEDVLNEILLTIEDKFDLERDNSDTNILKQISQILCKASSSKTIIVIDELSVSDNSTLKNIADSFIQLVTYYSNQTENNELKFVVSTISDPKDIIQNKSKASGYFQYICCDSWDNYSSHLFDILAKALNLELEDSKSTIIEESKNSPRTLKNIFQKIVIFNDSSEKSIRKAIKLTQAEIVG
ncbi:hypothetical protein [Patiriisocius sp. Uisw_017]|jgi:hypothetical protein|uniref:hypothetical protein n=1 Tax=Patiriisocius sp. Uisw_017 TaxID=3230968 RepID=UPI0039E971A4